MSRSSPSFSVLTAKIKFRPDGLRLVIIWDSSIVCSWPDNQRFEMLPFCQALCSFWHWHPLWCHQCLGWTSNGYRQGTDLPHVAACQEDSLLCHWGSNLNARNMHHGKLWHTLALCLIICNCIWQPAAGILLCIPLLCPLWTPDHFAVWILTRTGKDASSGQLFPLVHNWWFDFFCFFSLAVPISLIREMRLGPLKMLNTAQQVLQFGQLHFCNLLGRIYFWPGQHGRTAQFGGGVTALYPSRFIMA